MPDELSYKEIPKIFLRHRNIKSNMGIEEILELIYPEERNPLKKKVATLILNKLRGNIRQGLSKTEMSRFQKENQGVISKATFYRVLKDLKRLGFVRYENYAYTYYLSTDFSSALERLARSYRKWIEMGLSRKDKD